MNRRTCQKGTPRNCKVGILGLAPCKRKPYKKPIIRSEKVFETAALACGKCIAGNPIFKSGGCIPIRLS
ncbi:MAG: hypothetical protein A3J83_09235 [Elusimicrobia bacterium RIFOXYA2_FULL_40_6]|nr:MAG: hypothetical protein A3J83_09235 [Elusimicrobia bacterium RIFOXYA2_FULL_40_6]